MFPRLRGLFFDCWGKPVCTIHNLCKHHCQQMVYTQGFRQSNFYALYRTYCCTDPAATTEVMCYDSYLNINWLRKSLQAFLCSKTSIINLKLRLAFSLTRGITFDKCLTTSLLLSKRFLTRSSNFSPSNFLTEIA